MNKSLKSGLCVFLAIALVLTGMSAVMGNILPYERYGIAREDGSPLPNGAEITAWIDGVEYGSALVFDGDGSYQIFTDGDDDSDVTRKYGGVDGDIIYYIVDGLYIANEVDTFESSGWTDADLAFASAGQPSMAVKINDIVPQPGDAGTQYVYLYEPTGTIDMTRWRLETVGSVIGTLSALDTEYVGDLLYVDLGGAPLGTAAGHLMLSWQGAGGIAANNWVTLDRVEYGDQATAPENTIHPEYPTAPGVGEGLIRVVDGQDTDNSAVDFEIVAERGRPVVGDLDPVTGIYVEESGANIVVNWDPVAGATSYDVYYSADPYAAMPWTLLGNTGGTTYTDTGRLGGANYYYVRARDGAAEGDRSSIAYCVEREFVDDADSDLHYISVPARLNNIDVGDLSADDIVEAIEGGLGTSVRISRVVKWDYTVRGVTQQRFWRGTPFNSWSGGTDFAISPGDGIGIVLRTGADFSWHICGVDTEYSMSFVDDADSDLHYISLPYTLWAAEGPLRADDVVAAIEGGLGTSVRISRVVKWDYTVRGVTQQRFWRGTPFNSWSGGTNFEISPGDGIGIVLRTGADFTWDMNLISPDQG